MLPTPTTAPGTPFTTEGEGLQSVKVRAFDTSAVVVHRPDADELSRRREHSLGALRSRGLLDVLAGLPVGVAVPLDGLGKSSAHLLEDAPDGVVEFREEGVVRLAVAPTAPVLAVIHANNWVVGLERASRFTPHCPAVLVLPSQPEDAALAEAARRGVGVAVGPREEPTTALAPEDADRPFTSASWEFGELVLAHSVDR